MERTSIHSNQFIVGSIEKKNGYFHTNPQPKVHSSYKDAVHEAQRLAGEYSSMKFVVLAIAAVAYETPPKVTNVVVEYEL